MLLLFLSLMLQTTDLKDMILNNIDLIFQLVELIFVITIFVLVARLTDLFEVMQDAVERNADGTSI